jgi:hypothetical protein
LAFSSPRTARFIKSVIHAFLAACNAIIYATVVPGKRMAFFNKITPVARSLLRTAESAALT